MSSSPPSPYHLPLEEEVCSYCAYMPCSGACKLPQELNNAVFYGPFDPDTFSLPPRSWLLLPGHRALVHDGETARPNSNGCYTLYRWSPSSYRWPTLAFYRYQQGPRGWTGTLLERCVGYAAHLFASGLVTAEAVSLMPEELTEAVLNAAEYALWYLQAPLCSPQFLDVWQQRIGGTS